MTPDVAFHALNLAPGASPEEIAKAYKIKAKMAHPDAGGTADAFGVLTAAHAEALRYAAEEPCPECKGVGRRLHSDGWRSVNLICTACDETGRRWR